MKFSGYVGLKATSLSYLKGDIKENFEKGNVVKANILLRKYNKYTKTIDDKDYFSAFIIKVKYFYFWGLVSFTKNKLYITDVTNTHYLITQDDAALYRFNKDIEEELK